MQEIGIWSVAADGPARLSAASIDLERRLEDWIERDPQMVRDGLTVVGRQIHLEGGRLDLLALDPQGRLVVIEIKSGMLRRETLAQAIDYASSIARLPISELAAKVDAYLGSQEDAAGGKSFRDLLGERGAEENGDESDREVEICIVGTGTAPGLERMISYLSEKGQMPASVVLFRAFQLSDGQQVLVRELGEAEVRPSSTRAPVPREHILQLADRSGVGPDFRTILDAAERHGLYPRPYKRSIMFTPPSNKSRMLFTVWVEAGAKGGLLLWPSAEAFAEFYPLSVEEAVCILGESGGRSLSPGEAESFITALDKFFTRVGQVEGD